MSKKILLILFLFFITFSFIKAEDFELELNYPLLGSWTAPTDLPTYVNYIFNFSIIIVAFIIFGALIYGGIMYITSFGDPGKYGEAKKSILSAFLGGAILLSSWILFTTIRPEIENLAIDPLLAPGSGLYSGFYVCEKGIGGTSSLNQNIVDYVNISKAIPNITDHEQRREEVNKQAEARNEILKFIHDNNCRPINMSLSMNKTTLGFTPSTLSSVIFNIPSIPEHQFARPGLIIHSHDNFRGRCEIIPPLKDDTTYVVDFYNHHGYNYNNNFTQGNSDGTITSITVYNWFKPKPGETGSDNRAILYDNVYLDHERFHQSGTNIAQLFNASHNPPEPDLTTGSLQNINPLHVNLQLKLRSIAIEGNVIAIVSSDRTKGGIQQPRSHCAVIDKDVNILVNHHAIGMVCRIGTAGSDPDAGEDEVSRRLRRLETCATHIQLIKGEKL